MKRKYDFVTNSSSSSFIFIFNGNERATLFDLIRKYKEIFDLRVDWSYDDSGSMSCDYTYVISTINDCLNQKSIKFEKIDTLISNEKDQVKYWQKECRGKNQAIINDYSDYIQEHLNNIKTLENAKANGLTNCLSIDYGDNHGEVCGGKASVLDYNRDDVSLRKTDLVIITKCQH